MTYITVSCGGAGGSSGGGSGGSSASTSDVTGSIQDSTGSQTGMSGQVIVLTQRDTSMSYVSEITANGTYAFKDVEIGEAYTLYLLSSSYKYSAILSRPGTANATVQQWFTLSSVQIPRLKYNGLVLNFLDLDGITMTTDIAADADSDYIPDGSSYFAGLSLRSELNALGLTSSVDQATLSLVEQDTDTDSVVNTLDPDIDGDGIPNFIDDDDDGEGFLDVFDSDHNGDLVNDSIQETGDVYFSKGVEWVSAQISMEQNSSGSDEIYITYSVKLTTDYSPQYVAIRGAEAFTTGATVDGAEWDGKLVDDGTGEDGASGDLIYGKKVLVTSYPYGHQMIFFQIAYGSSADDPNFVEFPYTFPNLQPDKDIALAVNTSTHAFTLGGDSAFGSVTDYFWYVFVYDSDGERIYLAGPTSGSTSSITIPESNYSGGSTAIAVVQSQDRVAGKPAYIIKSPSVSVSSD